MATAPSPETFRSKFRTTAQSPEAFRSQFSDRATAQTPAISRLHFNFRATAPSPEILTTDRPCHWEVTLPTIIYILKLNITWSKMAR